MIPEIEKTTQLVREIATSSAQQAAGIDQINTSMQELSQITQSYAASAEEMAATSQNLVAHGVSLKEAVEYFKTGIRQQMGIGTSKKSERPNPGKSTQKTAKPDAKTEGNANQRPEEFVMPTNKPARKTTPKRPNAIEGKTSGTIIDMTNTDERDNEFESF